jgi:hypothetical protein
MKISIVYNYNTIDNITAQAYALVQWRNPFLKDIVELLRISFTNS